MSEDPAFAAVAAPPNEEKTTESVANPLEATPLSTDPKAASPPAETKSATTPAETRAAFTPAETKPSSADPSSEKTKDGQSNGNKSFHGKQEYKKFNNRQNGSRNSNIKTQFDDLPESNDPDEIRKQAEFYFSDSNLPGDKYLYEQVGGSENKPVPISLITSFKRMKRFKPFSAVVEALKHSDFLEVVGKDDIKRKEPITIPANYNLDPRAQLMEENDPTQLRSIYAKGFGEEGPRTQFDIEEFFEPFGPIKGVRLRRTNRKEFKGSAFVEFADETTMQEFLALETKPKWNGEDLKIMAKKEYCVMKLKDIDEGRVIPNTNKPPFHQNSRGRGNNQRRDDREWSNRREDFQRSSEFRGGRGRGRGGRGGDRRGGRDDRSGRGGRDRNGRNDRTPRGPELDDMGIPIVHISKPHITKKTVDIGTDTAATSGKKRSRDDDGPEVESPEKNVRTEASTDVTTTNGANSKKRQRGEGTVPDSPKEKKAKAEISAEA